MTTTAAPPAPPGRPGRDGGPEPGGPGRLGSRLFGCVLIAIALALVVAGVITPLAIVLSLPFLYMLVRKPVLRRLAVRNAARRPRETALVLLGALLGTAIITSAYVVGDTLRASIRSTVFTHFGPIDELVLTNGAANGARVRAALDSAHLSGTDGVLSLLAVPVSASSQGPNPRAEPTAQLIEMDFAAARAFGGDSSTTGVSGPTPSGDGAAISRDLADTTGLKVGDSVTVYAYGTSVSRRVVRVLPRLGVAGLRRFNTFGNLSPNVFAAPGTIAELERAGAVVRRPSSQVAPPVAMVAVSNTGGVLAGAKGTVGVKAELDRAVRGLPAHVATVKQDELDFADRFGRSFTQFFQQFGLFSVLAGVLLLVNIFVMLAQERKQSLGMLRAVGLRRSGLIGSFSLEGWLYALGSSALGALAGLGIGRLVVVAASRVFNSGVRRGGGLQLRFSASVGSVQKGFGVGFIIALVTVVLSSLYVARLNVIRAIRDLPEPPSTGRHLGRLIAGTVCGIAGVALTVGGFTGQQGILLLIGPALLGLGAVATLRTVPVRVRVTVVGTVVIAWTVLSFGVAHKAFEKAGILTFVVQGIILVAFAVALVTENQETIGAALRALGGGSRNMSLRLGLAYPVAKRFRTGLILAMYSIVVFFLVFLSVFSHLFGRQVGDFTRKLSGGSAIEVESNNANPVPPAGVRSLRGVTAVAAASQTTGEFRFADRGTDKDYQAVDSVIGFDQSFIGNGSPQVREAVGNDAYRQILADPSKVVVPREFLSRSNGPPGPPPKLGRPVLIRDPVSGQIRTLTIAGTVEANDFRGEQVYVAQSFAQSFFGPRASPSRLYVASAPGTDNEALAASINGRFVANGADANSFHHLVTQDLSAQLQFFTLIKGYVGLGLLVGIAGLGVVMVRAVRERRREIGVLRSLGFSGVAVRRAFVAESLFVAMEGILVGTALALVTAWRTVNSHAFGNGLHFDVPWIELSVLIVATAAASLLATAAPAVQASRIRPAVALRIAD